MKPLRIILFLLLAVVARADIFRFQIDSATYNDGSYFVGPYNSGFTNQDYSLYVPVESFCIDFTSHVGFGQVFDVTIVNLANFSGPMKVDYWEAGYLALQIMQTTDLATISNIQRAMWLITTPGSTDPYLNTPAALNWEHQAQQNYQSVSDSSFVLYLKVGEVGQNQLAVVPEPSTFAFALLGLISLLGFRRLRA